MDQTNNLYGQPEPIQQQQQDYQSVKGGFAPEQEQAYGDSGINYGVDQIAMESEIPQTTQEQLQQQYFQTETFSTEQPVIEQPNFENVQIDDIENVGLPDGTGTHEIVEPKQMEQDLSQQQPQPQPQTQDNQTGQDHEQQFIPCPHCGMQISIGFSVCPNCNAQVQY